MVGGIVVANLKGVADIRPDSEGTPTLRTVKIDGVGLGADGKPAQRVLTMDDSLYHIIRTLLWRGQYTGPRFEEVVEGSEE